MGDEVKIEETRTLSTDEGGSAAETGQEGNAQPTGDEPTGDGGDAAPEGDEPDGGDAA